MDEAAAKLRQVSEAGDGRSDEQQAMLDAMDSDETQFRSGATDTEYPQAQPVLGYIWEAGDWCRVMDGGAIVTYIEIVEEAPEGIFETVNRICGYRGIDPQNTSVEKCDGPPQTLIQHYEEALTEDNGLPPAPTADLSGPVATDVEAILGSQDASFYTRGDVHIAMQMACEESSRLLTEVDDIPKTVREGLRKIRDLLAPIVNERTSNR